MVYYNQISEGYEELHKEEQLKKLEIISKYIKPKKTELLLDVGCGTGLTVERWNCIRVGADPAIGLLEKAKLKNKNIFYINSEAENLSFKDSSFDFVISITAMQNFHNIQKGIKEIKRVGRKRFVLSALKRSGKIEEIKKIVNRTFKVKKIIEEDKDLILII